MFLLEDDVFGFKRWVPLIKRFNSEQILNLFQGERDYQYIVKNKEEKYQYIKPLWLNYICIEDIHEEIEKNLSEEKITSFLQSKNINYFKWP